MDWLLAFSINKDECHRTMRLRVSSFPINVYSVFDRFRPVPSLDVAGIFQVGWKTLIVLEEIGLRDDLINCVGRNI